MLKHLKTDGTEWCSLVETTVAMLMSEHVITLRGSSTRSGSVGATTMSEYCKSVAI